VQITPVGFIEIHGDEVTYQRIRAGSPFLAIAGAGLAVMLALRPVMKVLAGAVSRRRR
jgi:hypothetical protein